MSENRVVSLDNTSPLRLKTPLNVLILYYDEQFKSQLAHELVNCIGVEFEFITIGKASAEIFTTHDIPDLLFVQTGPAWAELIAQLQQVELNDDSADMSLIVFGDDGDNAALRMALRLGASDFLSVNSTSKELMPIFYTVAENKVNATKLADVYIFTNTKGGTGATTLCLNSAIDVAKHSSERVLYLDLDLHFGVTNDYLNIQSTYSITDAIDAYDDLDNISLQSLVTKHESGLNLLSYNPEMHTENFEKSRNIGSLIPVLRRYYKYIFVDLSTGLDRLFASVITQATSVFLVTQQNLVALKNASKISRSLRYEYGIPAESLILLINRYEKRQQIKLKDVENSFVGLSIYTIPNDFKVAIESANLGEPFILSKPHALISKSIHEFCQTFFYESEEEKGWFGRMFSK